jgi:REP element-mobilizing transposase RayT
MVIASHVIFSMHGFWLPNDPRGSWSKFVGAWELFRYGRATKTTETRSLVYRPHDRNKRLAAKASLKRPAVRINGLQARAVGTGFAAYARRTQLLIYACAISPDHVHLVLGRHRLMAEKLVVELKGAATRQLMNENVHPFAKLAAPGRLPPKCFARGE